MNGIEEEKDNSRRLPLLIGVLVLVLVCILCLGFLIVVYPLVLGPKTTSVPTIAQVALRPSLTPTPIPTQSLTPTITRTPFPLPSQTASQTPGPPASPTATLMATGLPTLTPSRPLPKSASYRLQGWSPEQADYAVQLMGGYPDTLTAAARGKDNAAYYAAYNYAVAAEREALLRFPDAPQADHWGWQLAYDLARTGSSDAGVQYASLIEAGLNRGETDIRFLYDWFQAKEPRLSLYMVELAPPFGYTGSYLVEVRGSGSAFIWLLQTPTGYRAYPLYTNFDFVNAPKANWILTNLSGKTDATDNQDVAIYFSNPPGQISLNPPRVFNLAQVPPKEMPFLPDHDVFNVGLEFSNYWEVRPDASGKNELAFKTTAFPACPVTIQRAYSWNGQYFTFVDEQFDVGSTPLSLGYCQDLVNQAATVWGPAAAISIMEKLSASWPPPKDPQGRAYPVDAKDEWLYRLGVYNALLGNTAAARDYFTEVVTNPSVHTSHWIAPSQAFLDAYRQDTDIYKACYGAEYCDSGIAIQYLVDHLPQGADALQYLLSQGVTTTSSGYFDFDKDQEAERWFTVRKGPREKLQFWILSRYSGGVKALPVAYVSSTIPKMDYLDQAYIAESGLGLQPAVFLDNKVALSMQRLPDTQEPYLASVPLRSVYPSPFFDRLGVAEAALFAGVSADKIQSQLQYMQQYPGLLCAPTWNCDQYYYLLGLSSELSGNEPAAVDAYHQVWLDYSKSPYTTLARLKLASGPLITPVPTVAPTATPGLTLAPTPTFGTPFAATTQPTLTPTITGTRPTATPTVSGTPRTATPTISGTPPTVTPTITGTPPTATPTITGTPPTSTPSPSATQTLTGSNNPTATSGAYPFPTEEPTYNPYPTP